MSDVDRANDRARDQALKKGRAVYQVLVVDTWPACVDCGQPIRNRPSVSSGPYRACACVDRQWRFDSLHGWQST